ncbi:MAG: uridine diphosphate-N-acetylglucosamine-binding protein YvcK [Candidatus Limnocylindrales bacterium]
MNLRRWLRPGMGIKRWLGVVFIGELSLALGGAFALRQLYRDTDVSGPFQATIYLATLQFLPYIARGIILGGLGAALFLAGSIRVIQAFMNPFRSPDADQPLVELIYQKRFLARGPKIVAIGGGTGLSTLLRGLKEHTSNLTAVVTVADDGGSSGKLREQLGVPAVGDIRNCIVALADAEPLMAELLQYRFPESERTGSSDDATTLGGHAVGNLLIAALTAVEGGDFEEGVRQMNRVLAVRGQVLPVSPTPLVLHCETRDGWMVHGQSAVAKTTDIERVWVTPGDVAVSEDALRAIAEADVVVLGPGSLYTSILPGLLLAPIRDAILASSALRIYVCNVATQDGETAGYDLADHVDALERHSAAGIVDVVIANSHVTTTAPEGRGEAVRPRWPPAGPSVPRLVLDDVVDPAEPTHHDPAALAAAIVRVVEREGGARRRAGVARTA